MVLVCIYGTNSKGQWIVDKDSVKKYGWIRMIGVSKDVQDIDSGRNITRL